MNSYIVYGVNGRQIVVQADDFDADENRVMFSKGDNNIAWFKSENIVGFVQVSNEALLISEKG